MSCVGEVDRGQKTEAGFGAGFRTTQGWDSISKGFVHVVKAVGWCCDGGAPDRTLLSTSKMGKTVTFGEIGGANLSSPGRHPSGEIALIHSFFHVKLCDTFLSTLRPRLL